MSKAEAQSNIGSSRTENAFASLLLRDGLLSNLLTDDYANITYWAGKDLARQFPQETIEHLANFFNKAAFGDLTIAYQGESEQRWVLSGPVVQDRLAVNRQADFSLETGFLAQQVEIQNEAVCEGYFELSTRKQEVTITIMIDGDHRVDSLTPSDQVALRDYFFDQMHGRQVQAQNEPAADSQPESEAPVTTSTAPTSAATQKPAASPNDMPEATAPKQDTSEVVQEETTSFEDPADASVSTPADAPVEDEDEAISVEQSITNSLLAFDFKAKKPGDNQSQLDR